MIQHMNPIDEEGPPVAISPPQRVDATGCTVSSRNSDRRQRTAGQLLSAPEESTTP